MNRTCRLDEEAQKKGEQKSQNLDFSLPCGGATC